jgi:hypothetical protein
MKSMNRKQRCAAKHSREQGAYGIIIHWHEPMFLPAHWEMECLRCGRPFSESSPIIAAFVLTPHPIADGVVCGSAVAACLCELCEPNNPASAAEYEALGEDWNRRAFDPDGRENPRVMMDYTESPILLH